MEDSGVQAHVDPTRLGVFMGSGIGGIHTFIDECHKMDTKGPGRISPFFIPMMISNIAAGTIAIRYNAQGPCLPIVTACATGTHSIGEAFRSIKHGYADAIIAGGTIDEPIKRHPVDRIKMAILPGGKEAVTHYNVKERFQHFTRIQARLETGRTHQIRVHFSYIGHGLIGDSVYMNRVRVPAGASELLADTLRGFKRQALHAAKLGLVHPRTGEDMMFEAPWPEDFSHLVDVLRTENKAY